MKQKWSKIILDEFHARREIESQFSVIKTSRSTCLLRYNDSQSPKVFLRIEIVENRLHCGFILSCFVSEKESIHDDFLAINFPKEVAANADGGFDVGLLFGSHAFRWSVLNDSLDMNKDAGVQSSDEVIQRRIQHAISDAVEKVQALVIPFIQHEIRRQQ